MNDQVKAELAPIRVGSWQWAMVQTLLGNAVVDAAGEQIRIIDGETEFLRRGEWKQCFIRECYGPYTLHAEPEPEPTAAELITLWRRIDGHGGKDAWDEMRRLVARVKRLEGDK